MTEILKIITESGLTTYAAAKKAGVPLSTVYDWVSGRRVPSQWTVEGFRRAVLG